VPAEPDRAFGKPVAARGMVRARHDDGHAGIRERGDDAFVVGRDDDLDRARGERPARDVQHHRHTRDRQQRFAGETGGAVAGGNRDTKSWRIGLFDGWIHRMTTPGTHSVPVRPMRNNWRIARKQAVPGGAIRPGVGVPAAAVRRLRGAALPSSACGTPETWIWRYP